GYAAVPMAGTFRYSRWDGTQQGFDLDADAALSALGDDLLYHGDLNAALRRALREGLQGRDGRNLEGLRQLIERIKARREAELARHDMSGLTADIARRLDDIVDTERAALERDGGEEAARRRDQLDELPPDLAGRFRGLREYPFVAPSARDRFNELAEELQRQLLQSQFNRMAGSMSGASPEQMARLKDMLADLNRMLAQREEGVEPDFAGFMDRYGDLFGGNPQSLDELVDQIARSMAQMQALMASMTPEQRRQLQDLADALLDDLDLRWELDDLARRLQDAYPGLPWEQGYDFSGADPLDLAGAPGVLERLGSLDELEHLLRAATSPAQLSEVDLDRARELLGDEAAESLAELAELARMLEDAGLIDSREGRYELTPRALRRIGQRALGELFARLAKDRIGGHQVEHTGFGHERSAAHKPYEFGDPFALDVEQTVRNALRRQGAGVPVHLAPADFEVAQMEQLARSATVLLLDLSLSMPMRDNFLAAKKVAVALHALISGRFPRDFLAVVGFSEVAREIKAHQLPEVSWDFGYGTNMAHALLLARRLLAGQHGTRQVIMITDGEPTAHVADGEVFFHYPPVPETIRRTLAEVDRCTRDGIRINTFMLDASPGLRRFVERMTQINRGRAFFTTPSTLGDYVLVDFVDHKRRRLRAS
ncbi:MAG: VWA domain-containing protein, partial [Acidimicrobiia bacterium]